MIPFKYFFLLCCLHVLGTNQCLSFTKEDSKIVRLMKRAFLQEQFTSPQTTYVIQGDLDLNGQTLKIPPQSIIKFKLGCLKNGKVIFDGTELRGNVRIECDFEGSLNNEEVYVDWFIKGSKSVQKSLDVSNVIQAIFDMNPPKVVFGGGYYRFHNIRLPKEITILGQKTIILPEVSCQNVFRFNFLKNVFYAEDSKRITIKNICFEAETTGTILPSFQSDSIYGEPLIWVNRGDEATIERCVFKDIENCTYCNKAYTEYSKKQGSCVCLWDVSKAFYINNEQVNCRHDEQVWIIGVKKPIMSLTVVYKDNYIHDMTPGPNSSAFTCVAGYCLVENNRVERYSYPGSMFNVFAKQVVIKNNSIKNSYCSSVFDTCEYRYFHNDDIDIRDNDVEAVNSVLVLAQSNKVNISNNIFKGLSLYCSANYRIQNKSNYPYWYTIESDVLPTDTESIIDGNIADFTYYDGKRSIAGTKADYGTGQILEPQKYSNVGQNYGCGILIHPSEAKAGHIIIKNNRFTSLNTLDGMVDDNNLRELYPHTIRLVNTNNATIVDNVFNGACPIRGIEESYTYVSLYSYPDLMEQLDKQGDNNEDYTHYDSYEIKGNVFNAEAQSFSVLSLFPRRNARRDTPIVIDRVVIEDNYVPQKTVAYRNNGKVMILKESFQNNRHIFVK